MTTALYHRTKDGLWFVNTMVKICYQMQYFPPPLPIPPPGERNNKTIFPLISVILEIIFKE